MTIIPKGINIIVTMNLKREHFYLANKFKFEVTRVLGVDLADSSRAMNLNMMRMAFVYLCRTELSKCSYEDLGILTNRQHATIIHSFKQAKALMQSNDKLFKSYYGDVRICFENIKNCINEATLVEMEGLKMHTLIKEYLSQSMMTDSQKQRSLQILISRID